MKGKIILLFIFILCSHSSDAQRGYSEEQQKKYIPKKEKKFVLAKKKFTLNDTSIISQNAVYINILEEQYRENYRVVKTTYSYTHMRFFTDGRVFISHPYLSYPSIEEFNDMTYGRWGYYIIKKGKIKIEYYTGKQHGMMYMFAKPVTTGITFYKTTGIGIGQILKVSRDTGGVFYRKDYTKLYNWQK